MLSNNENNNKKTQLSTSIEKLKLGLLLENEDEQVLLEPFKYLLEIPGKEIRSKLIKAFNKWLQIDEKYVQEISEIIGMLHTASLLIDDIEDNSKLRRGVPVAHSIYGIPSTINCANFVYFKALDKCNLLGNSKATDIFIEELLSLHRGQGLDIYWRDNNQCPSEEQYKQMVIDKTGGLFRLAVRLMQCFSKNQTDFIPLVNSLGLFFQIRDDFINLTSSDYMINKSFCEDLTEGKFSFPIIHSLQTNKNDNRLLKILKQKTEDIELKKYALTIMEQTGSFEYTKKVIYQFANEIFIQIQHLGGHQDLEILVKNLLESINK